MVLGCRIDTWNNVGSNPAGATNTLSIGDSKMEKYEPNALISGSVGYGLNPYWVTGRSTLDSATD